MPPEWIFTVAKLSEKELAGAQLCIDDRFRFDDRALKLCLVTRLRVPTE